MSTCSANTEGLFSFPNFHPDYFGADVIFHTCKYGKLHLLQNNLDEKKVKAKI